MTGTPDLIAALTSVATGAISVLLLYLGAKRLGLTDLQKAVSTETERLILAMKERIGVLENTLVHCKEENSKLVSEVEGLRERVDGLETKIADLLLTRQTRRKPPVEK